MMGFPKNRFYYEWSVTSRGLRPLTRFMTKGVLLFHYILFWFIHKLQGIVSQASRGTGGMVSREGGCTQHIVCRKCRVRLLEQLWHVMGCIVIMWYRGQQGGRMLVAGRGEPTSARWEILTTNWEEFVISTKRIIVQPIRCFTESWRM